MEFIRTVFSCSISKASDIDVNHATITLYYFVLLCLLTSAPDIKILQCRIINCHLYEAICKPEYYEVDIEYYIFSCFIFLTGYPMSMSMSSCYPVDFININTSYVYPHIAQFEGAG